MTRRYDCLVLSLFTAAFCVTVNASTASAQALGACCIDVVNQSAPKVEGTAIQCEVGSFLDCQGVGGEYQGDRTLCGEPPYFDIDDCRNAILPVELTSFDALVDGRAVKLAWSTSSELNNAGFSVEQVVGTGVFAEIGYVEGHGTTIRPREYSFEIADLDPGIHRFRLKQIDFDGAFEYSPIVEAAITVPNRFLIESAYPNPFNPSTTLRFAVAAEQHVVVTLVNAAGQSIRTLHSGVVGANDTQQLTINAATLPSGTYLVHFTGDGLSATERIVVAK